MSKKIAQVITVLVLFSSAAFAQFRVVGYLPNWGSFVADAQAIDYTKITHMNIAFINPDNTGALSPSTGLTTVAALAHSNNVKILASLGGSAASSSFSSLLLDSNRAAFISKIVAFVNANNLDGIDVDLEGSSIDANYQNFVTDLRTALPGKLLTAAVATWFGTSITDGALAQFDFVNVMSYDATGPWAPNNPGPHSPYSLAVSDFEYWSGRIAANKISIGLPFYGYMFGNTNYPSTMTFAQIVATFPGSQNVDEVDPTSGGALYYNGIPTIKAKTTFALQNAGGVMIWQLSQDASAPYSLLDAIGQAIRGFYSDIPPTVSITSPANQSTYYEGDTIKIAVNAADSNGAVASVSLYAGAFSIANSFTSPYSFNWTSAGAGTYALYATAIDTLGGMTNSDTVTIIVNNPPEGPFGGTPWPIPGMIQAENFNVGGQNVAYYDNTIANLGGDYRTTMVDIETCIDVGGGYDVGWIAAGEWLDYTVNVSDSAQYDIQVRLATDQTNSMTLHLQMDGQNISGAIDVPNTGGWQNWQTATVSNVPLTKGIHTMRIMMDVGGYNINYINFVTAIPLGIESETYSSQSIYAAPNPFQSSTSIYVNLTASSYLKIMVYDQFGKQVAILADQTFGSGTNVVEFDKKDLPQGMYFCRISGSGIDSTLKLITQ